MHNATITRHQQQDERLRRDTYAMATPTHTRRRPLMSNQGHFDFNSLEIFSRGYSSASRGALFGPARDQSTDTIDELSPVSPTPPSLHSEAPRRPSLQHSGSRLEVTNVANVHGGRSAPVSPALGGRRRPKASGRSLFYSPMMLRKVVKQK